jgi:hypothetical protein
MKLYSIFNSSGAFPVTVAVNVSAPGAGDGTEFNANFCNDTWGWRQDVLQRAGMTPDGVDEASGTSQTYEALQKCFGHPGEIVLWPHPTSPAPSGIRLLPCNGTVISVSTYQDLVDAVYVGDANNNNFSYQGFYKTSEQGGTARSTSGTYFVLPDLRGSFMRGYDPTAISDPDGASRVIPSSQAHGFQVHGHELTSFTAGNYCEQGVHTTGGVSGWQQSASAGIDRLYAPNNASAFVGGNPISETRPYNFNAQWCVRF